MFVGGRRLGLVPVAVALVLILSACGGSSDKPQTLPPLSTSPSTTTPTSPPPNPKAAAVGVVREYFKLLSNLENRMDAGAFKEIETRSCSCRKFVRSLLQIKQRGQYYFGQARITHTTAAVDSPDAVEVLTTYDATVGGIKDSDGHVVTSEPGRRGVTANFFVNRVDGTWLIANIVAVKKGRAR